MDSGFLRKYTQDPALGTGAERSVVEIDGTEDYGAFGWLRGIRDRAIMLELRRKSGDVRALGYSWIERIDFDPSVGITLWHVREPIRIAGRNLSTEARPMIRLFDGLVRQRVPWVQESTEADALEAPPSACVIELIKW